jgi:acyl-homoserine-lactone acylase
LPKVIDPPSGYVQNTNDPPWNAAWPNSLDPSQYPPYIAPVAASFRAERSLRMLYENKKITYDQFIELKHSTRAELADRILPDLLDATAQYGTPLAQKAADVLKSWDRQAEADSRGGVLFHAWTTRFMGGPLMASQAAFAVPYDLKSPLTTPRGLKDPKKAAAQLDSAAQELQEQFGALDVPWGQVMHYRLGGVELPANGGYGNMGIFRVITFGPLQNKVRTQTHGETYIAAVEFGEPMRAKVLLTYGNSSQPGTPHQTDQLPLLAKKELRQAWLTKQEAEANLSTRDRF